MVNNDFRRDTSASASASREERIAYDGTRAPSGRTLFAYQEGGHQPLADFFPGSSFSAPSP